jgi:UDP-N-acetylglucosamine--N-acetylmuramyl-(pentapeptide) pyrophosphoryl-undecaprenol N-acetylglucosamine transferase
MKIKSKPKETDAGSILIAAAGTGGHIMPAMAVADKLINKKFNLFWAGTPNGMENRIVDKKKDIFYFPCYRWISWKEGYFIN